VGARYGGGEAVIRTVVRVFMLLLGAVPEAWRVPKDVHR
jgi:hypothetical protein